jgi:hypothetical protein
MRASNGFGGIVCGAWLGRCQATLLDLRSLTLGNRITALGNELALLLGYCPGPAQ